jgi:DNA-directed RNA polymerase subunit M/transcription elongation factor TFIIS
MYQSTKIKCGNCGNEESVTNYIHNRKVKVKISKLRTFKTRLNHPHGKKSKSKLTITCKRCNKLQ